MASKKAKRRYILALDQGTSSSRAVVFDYSGVPISQVNKELSSFSSNPGWVEQNPFEIYQSQILVAKEALKKAGIESGDLDSIGIANQRETTIIWDKKSGQPVYNAIVWQDRRTAQYCDSLKTAGSIELVQKTSGLVLDPYFSASKIRWILDNIENGQSRAEAGELAFGTVDTWLLWNLTSRKSHFTDYSNASRTLLFNINSKKWDQELLDLFKIPSSILPQVFPSGHFFGEGEIEFLGTPIHSMVGDQQSALYGQCCFKKGMVKNTYGTGCFLLMNVGSEFIASKNNLITTISTAASENNADYVLEGSVFIAGAAIKWLRDNLGLISSTAEIDQLIRSTTDNAGVYLVPAFSGLGAPHWDPYARGVFSGLTLNSNKAHLVRAAVESMAFQTFDVLRAMEEDSHTKVSELRVDGGAAINDYLLQFQADILNVPVSRSGVLETTALGAAFLAGVSSGFWKDQAELEGIYKRKDIFEPSMSESKRESFLTSWNQAVSRSLLK